MCDSNSDDRTLIKILRAQGAERRSPENRREVRRIESGNALVSRDDESGESGVQSMPGLNVVQE
jgi:hypothetical protein